MSDIEGLSPEAQTALQAALKMLRRTERFVSDVRESLRAKGHDETAIDESLALLTKRGLLNDARAAERWLEAKTSAKNALGADAIRDALSRKGLAEASIEAFLEAHSLPSAEEALRARFRPEDDPHRAARFLARRGFSEEAAGEALERYFGETFRSEDA